MTKPHCKLAGDETFDKIEIIHKISDCLRQPQAREFRERALSCKSRKELLALIDSYVVVSI